MSIKSFAFAFMLESIIYSCGSCVGQVYLTTYNTGTISTTDELPSTSSPYQSTAALTFLISSSKDSSTTYAGSVLDHSSGFLSSPSTSLQDDTSASTAHSTSVTPHQPSSTLDGATNDSNVTSNDNNYSSTVTYTSSPTVNYTSSPTVTYTSTPTVTYTSSYLSNTSPTSLSNKDKSATYSAFTSYQTTGNGVGTSTANSASGLPGTDMSSHNSNQNQTRTEVSTESGPSSPLTTSFKIQLTSTPIATSSDTSRIITFTGAPSTTATISNTAMPTTISKTTTISNTTRPTTIFSHTAIRHARSISNTTATAISKTTGPTTISTEPTDRSTGKKTTTRPIFSKSTTRSTTRRTTTPHVSTAGAMTSCIIIYLTFASFVLLNNFRQL